MPNEDYRTIIEELARTRSSQLQIFEDFCKVSVCALSLGSREKEYHAIATRYNSEEMQQFSKAFAYLVNEMEGKPFTDILGEFYLEIASHSSKQARGEFFTPPTISKMMARMLYDVERAKFKGIPITVNDPACGSGGMVLAVAQRMAVIFWIRVLEPRLPRVASLAGSMRGWMREAGASVDTTGRPQQGRSATRAKRRTRRRMKTRALIAEPQGNRKLPLAAMFGQVSYL